MVKVSIVAPVYNSMPYLTKCLDSLCSQTIEDVEFIVVDDCSTDDSVDAVCEFRRMDRRVILVRQDRNSGPGAARNAGIRRASGEYIGFVDSDDWIDADYFESMYEHAISNEADMVLNDNVFREYTSGRERYITPGAPTFSGEGRVIDSVISANYCIPSMYTRLYRRQLLTENGIFCPESYSMHEDRYFNYASSVYANKIYAYAGPAYHYRKTPDSITERISFYNVNIVRFLEDLRSFLGQVIYQKEFKLKLFNSELYSEINCEEEFIVVKRYLLSLKDYFEKSGVYVSDFDRYAIENILQSVSSEDLTRRIGKKPLLRYLTRERIKNNLKIRISVIIPVYNAEEFLDRCLQSVCSQTLRDIEIICISDGPADTSLDVLKHFAFEDNRIKILESETNRGFNDAVNRALTAAKGEFVHFIGSADWLDAGYLEGMLTVMEKEKSDMAVNTNLIYESVCGEGNSADDWPRLYRKSFLQRHGITFPIVDGDIAIGRVFAFRGEAYHRFRYCKTVDSR